MKKQIFTDRIKETKGTLAKDKKELSRLCQIQGEIRQIIKNICAYQEFCVILQQKIMEFCEKQH